MTILKKIFAQIIIDRDYCFQKITYECLPFWIDHIKDGEINIEEWKKWRKVYAINDQLTNLPPFQKEDSHNLNMHLSSEIKKCIENAVVESNNTYIGMEVVSIIRRSWGNSNYSGNINCDKTILELVKFLYDEMLTIRSSKISFKEQVAKFRIVFTEMGIIEYTKFYFGFFIEDALLKLSEFRETTSSYYFEYKEATEKLKALFNIVRKILTFKTAIKELQEDGKRGKVDAAMNYAKIKYNRNIISFLLNKVSNDKPILLPIVSVPKIIDFQLVDYNRLDDIDYINKQIDNENIKINLLPLAFACYLQQLTDWDLEFEINDDSIIKKNYSNTSRREGNKAARFGKPSLFSGKPITSRKYILIDDCITLGGSLRDLQEYIEINNSSVLFCLTIDRSIRLNINPNIKPSNEELATAKQKFKHMDSYLENILGYKGGIECLTKQEISALENSENFTYDAWRSLNENLEVKNEYVIKTRKLIKEYILSFRK
jgi:hypothetical protein